MHRILSLIFGLIFALAAAGPTQHSYAALLRAHAWLNGTPQANSLQNKVVLVDVFTFDCINCKHVIPELRRLNAARNSDLVIVGIHSPETPYERERANVAENLRTQGITWPVALDNDFALWKAYGIEYWPTQLIFDRHGRLRATIVGEGRDAEVASTVVRLENER